MTILIKFGKSKLYLICMIYLGHSMGVMVVQKMDNVIKMKKS